MTDIENTEKINSLADSAVATIREYQAKRCVPILLVFASPDDGFEHARAISPTGLNCAQTIKHLYEAKFSRLN